MLLEDYDVDEFEAADIPEGEQDEESDTSSVRLSCFAHTMQLCIRDGLQKVPYVPKVLGKCQVLAKAAHKSTKLSDLLESLNKHINKANRTRWNSEYLLCKSILAVGKTDLESIAMAMETPVKFSNNDLIVLEEIGNILDPFCEISIRCQAELAASASMVVPSISYLLCHLSEMKRSVKLSVKLIDQLQISIETRFAGILNRLHQRAVGEDEPFNDPLFFMATVLDPQFKFYWLRDMKFASNVENRFKQTIIQLIIDEISKDSSTASARTTLTSQSTAPATPFFASTTGPKRKKLFHYGESADDVNTLDPAIELQAYLEDPVKSKFSEYWFHSQLPLLKKLVTLIFSVQASSAPVERVFSYAGMIQSPRRTNMSEKLFKDLVFLRVNQAMLWRRQDRFHRYEGPFFLLSDIRTTDFRHVSFDEVLFWILFVIVFCFESSKKC